MDFAGMLELWFRALADQVYLVTGQSFRVLPIGEPGGSPWMLAIQSQFEGAATALGLPPPVDLASFDLSNEEDHIAFMFVVSQEARALRTAAGLP